MSEEVNVKKKIVETEVVELKIEISKELFDRIESAKKDVADKRGYDITYGQYVEEAFEDFITMIDRLAQSNEQLKAALEYQQGMPQVVERETEPQDPETKEAEPAPENFYAMTSNKDVKDPMFQ